MKKSIIIIGVIVILFILAIVIFDITQFSSSECTVKGGNVVNTLGGDNCQDNEINIGSIDGLKCPCICCVPK